MELILCLIYLVIIGLGIWIPALIKNKEIKVGKWKHYFHNNDGLYSLIILFLFPTIIFFVLQLAKTLVKVNI